MKLDKIAGSGNDEYYTPSYAIKPILKYLKPKSTVWCPFDTEHSFFVKLLRQAGHTVIYTHKDTDGDFFSIPCPPNVDYIISNPPYSCKGKVFEHLFKLGVPFMMLVGVVGLFESQQRFEMFRDNDFEIMYLNRRVAYFKDYEGMKTSINPPFSSVYLCHGVLPKQIVFEEIDKTNNKGE